MNVTSENVAKAITNAALSRIITDDPILADRKDGFPEVGTTRPDGKNYSKAVLKVAEGYKVYDELVAAGRLRPNERELNYTSGNPLNYDAFQGSKKQIAKYLDDKKMHAYPYTEGDDERRLEILRYLEREGFINNEPYSYEDIDEFGLSRHNLTFTNGTSQAWQFIIETIAKPNDVIIFPGPNYGLFAIKPEKMNCTVELIPMEKEDGYLVNPEKLAKLILETNAKLAKEYVNASYIPKVVAFVNANPNNPTGKSMGEEETERLTAIGNVCKENSVFVIDDLVYRDIVFDEKKKAKPMASIPGMFRNTISILGLSKSYGMPAIRAGMVVADEVIIRKIINLIFRDEDAISAIAGEALSGAFNATDERYNTYEVYFKHLRKAYIDRYNIVKALVCGISSIQIYERENVLRNIFEYANDVNETEIKEMLENGIKGVEILDNLEPESGFFLLLCFNGLKGKHYGNDVINNEVDCLRYFYKKIKLRYILGSGCLWPNENDIMGRITFAKPKEELVYLCSKINWAVKQLDKNEKTPI